MTNHVKQMILTNGSELVAEFISDEDTEDFYVIKSPMLVTRSYNSSGIPSVVFYPYMTLQNENENYMTLTKNTVSVTSIPSNEMSSIYSDFLESLVEYDNNNDSEVYDTQNSNNTESSDSIIMPIGTKLN